MSNNTLLTTSEIKQTFNPYTPQPLNMSKFLDKNIAGMIKLILTNSLK